MIPLAFFRKRLYILKLLWYYLHTLFNRAARDERWRICLNKISVYCDPAGLEELHSRTPYNLRKDLKDIDDDTIAQIAEELGNEIKEGLNRPPTAVALRWGKNRKAACAKIRTVDVARDSGKSGGYRCIVLVDYVNNSAFLLHLYRHGHGENDNIDRKSRNMLDKLVDEYSASLEQQAKKQLV